MVDFNRADELARRDDGREYLERQLTLLDPSSGSQYLDTYDRLQQRYVALANSTDSVYLLVSALPPSGPARPDPGRYLLVALLAGVPAGLLAALLLERLDGRLRTAEDLAAARHDGRGPTGA